MNKKTIKSILVILAISAAIILFFILIMTLSTAGAKKKPVIYLYPETEVEVKVKIKYDGKLSCTYPEYIDGWRVKASPDGTLINLDDNKLYSYLFWEGEDHYRWDIDTGFVVEGNQTALFLQEKLAFLGLTPKEYNEFIVYWLPIMEENKYNLIYFAGEEYDEQAKLEIEPKPDSIIRVFMVYKPLDKYIDIKEQELESFTREGFTVVEWGGTEIN